VPNKRELYKDIEEGGRKWRIGKWNARLANYWLNKLIMKARVAGREGISVDAVVGNLAALNKADYFEFQNDCLSVCSELTELADGQKAPVPVLRVDGTFNVPELDYDNETIMALTLSAFMFSVQDPFFEESKSEGSDKGA